MTPDGYEGLISAAEASATKATGLTDRMYWKGYADGVRALRALLVAEGGKGRNDE
jgi:hypothetical protein